MGYKKAWDNVKKHFQNQDEHIFRYEANVLKSI